MGGFRKLEVPVWESHLTRIVAYRPQNSGPYVWKPLYQVEGIPSTPYQPCWPPNSLLHWFRELRLAGAHINSMNLTLSPG